MFDEAYCKKMIHIQRTMFHAIVSSSTKSTPWYQKHITLPLTHRPRRGRQVYQEREQFVDRREAPSDQTPVHLMVNRLTNAMKRQDFFNRSTSGIPKVANRHSSMTSLVSCFLPNRRGMVEFCSIAHGTKCNRSSFAASQRLTRLPQTFYSYIMSPARVSSHSAEPTVNHGEGLKSDSHGASSTSANVSNILHEPEFQPQTQLRASTKLRQILTSTSKLIVCPGVYDGLSARLALDVGFDAMYMTGAGTTASRLGQPDLGIAQLADMRANAEMIANLDPTVPLVADMDTGFGSPIMVDRAVSEYARAGIAAFHIEDQLFQKRCGHLAGKEVVSVEEYVTRVKAAKLAKEKAHSDIVIIGRTDALQKHGYEEAVRRLRAAREAGADVGQLEGVTSKDMARQAVKDLAPMPLLLNMVEHGATPVITTKEAEEMGYRFMIFSFACLGPAFIAMRETLQRLKTEGVTGLPDSVKPKTIFDVCGLQEKMDIDQNAGGGMEKA
nr:2,3-dimethylmalate lyase [Quercus suber]